MVMPLHKKEKPGSWQVKREQIVIYVICIFVVTGLVVSMIQRPVADPDILHTVEPVMLVQQSAPTNPIEERDTQCRTSLDALCKSNEKFNIRMIAIPHTASSSTDKLFRSSGKRAWNTSVAIEDKGFFCTAPSKHIQIQTPPCQNQVGNASTDLFGCVLRNFYYSSKTHQPYNRIYKKNR
jgi:hypothetical protein